MKHSKIDFDFFVIHKLIQHLTGNIDVAYKFR